MFPLTEQEAAREITEDFPLRKQLLGKHMQKMRDKYNWNIFNRALTLPVLFTKHSEKPSEVATHLAYHEEGGRGG